MAETEHSLFREELQARQRRLQSVLAVAPKQAELSRLLTEVDAALARLEAGTFGRCEVCNDPIEPDRLIADPLVRFCLDHLTPDERDALQQDLDLALQIQNSLLPPNPLVLAGWELAYHYQPRGPVSGDYCDVIRPGDGASDRFVFLTGDVAGKGVAASLLMSHLHAIFRSLVSVGLPISDAMERANRVFCESTMPSHYATLIGGLAGSRGEIEFCCAGHCAPMLVRQTGVTPVEVGGLPLGLFCTAPFPAQRFQQAPGDVLVLYTDGLTEASNRADQEYGVERLKNLLRGAFGRPAAGIVESCVSDLRTFLDGAPLHDDLTVLVIRRLGEVV